MQMQRSAAAVVPGGVSIGRQSGSEKGKGGAATSGNTMQLSPATRSRWASLANENENENETDDDDKLAAGA